MPTPVFRLDSIQLYRQSNPDTLHCLGKPNSALPLRVWAFIIAGRYR
jgi:hypothetical protein